MRAAWYEKQGPAQEVLEDDLAPEDKAEAAMAINDILEGGWRGFEIAARFPLEQIAAAHERVENPQGRGRVVLTI